MESLKAIGQPLILYCDGERALNISVSKSWLKGEASNERFNNQISKQRNQNATKQNTQGKRCSSSKA